MSHPSEPSGFLPEHSPAGATWHWVLLDADGAEVTGPHPRFTSQADAETWVGEEWRELAEGGVDAVVLMDGERKVYGPMSLSP